MSISKRLLLALVVLFTFFLTFYSLPPSASAQINLNANLCDILNSLNIFPTNPPWYNDNVCGFSQKVFNSPADELYGERYTYAQVSWIIHSLMLQSPLGTLFQTPILPLILNIFVENPTSPDLAKLGIPGTILSGISYMIENPVASGVDYTRQTLARLNLIPSAHAQGYGFGQLSSIQWLWRASRNSAYLVVVILLIISAFAIMFRLKLNPQTAITIQLLVPKLIITLVGITFSYAIGGFIIDLIFVAISLFVAAMTLGSGVNFSFALPILTSNFGVFAALYFIILNILALFNMTAQGMGGPILFMILFIVVVFLLLKVFWMLLKTYVTLIALIIFGPWMIMLGILPGNAGFSGWVRNTIANASIFVVVPIMFFFNLVFWVVASAPGGLVRQILSIAQPLLPSPIDSVVAAILNLPSGQLPQLPLVGGANSSLVYMVIGYVFLAMTPKVAEMVKEYLKVPSFKYGSAIGEALGPVGIVTAPVGTAARGAYNTFGQPYVNAAINPIIENIRSRLPNIPTPGPRPPTGSI
jgi:hypothetical protein